MSKSPPGIRLQKFLSASGVASLRKAENMIAAGRVMVNGTVITSMGTKVDPRKDRIEVDGELVPGHRPPIHLMLNKPAGYLATVSDDRGRPTVMDLIKEKNEKVFPVGRLDLDATGLILLTNQGELSNRLLHPRYRIEKAYRVTVEGQPDQGNLRALVEGGVPLPEDRPSSPAKVKVLTRRSRSTVLEIVITEGRKRIVKRMMAAVGHPVIRLHRTRFGPLTLGRLASGKARPLRPEEITALNREVGL